MLQHGVRRGRRVDVGARRPMTVSTHCGAPGIVWSHGMRGNHARPVRLG